MAEFNIWFEGGATPGPGQLEAPGDEPPETWTVEVRTGTAETEEGGAPPASGQFPYRRTDRAHQGRVVYEPVPGPGH